MTADLWDDQAAAIISTAGPDQFATMVEAELLRLRVQREARRLYDRDQTGPRQSFDLASLAELLARPDEPPERVDDLIPWQASTLITAARKTGKTTLVLGLARDLLTGEPFLGQFEVRRLEGDIALLNFEVAGAQIGRWAAEVGVPPHRLHVVNLRGCRNPLTSDEGRAELAPMLRARGVEAVIIDPFGRAYTGASQNDAGEVTGWLVGLDQWARGEVGANDLILTAHAGWDQQRTRGSSALEDWADVIITLTRDDTADGDRYLRALGRDVEVEEDRLVFDPARRRLTLAGAGSRTVAKVLRHHEALRAAVLDIVKAEPGLNVAAVERKLREAGVNFQRGQEGQALTALVTIGELEMQIGTRGAKCYSPASFSPPTPDTPDPPHGVPGDPPQPPLISGVGPRGGSDEQAAATSWGGSEAPASTCQVCKVTGLWEPASQERGICKDCFRGLMRTRTVEDLLPETEVTR